MIELLKLNLCKVNTGLLYSGLSITKLPFDIRESSRRYGSFLFYTLLKKYTETSLKRVGTLQTRMIL